MYKSGHGMHQSMYPASSVDDVNFPFIPIAPVCAKKSSPKRRPDAALNDRQSYARSKQVINMPVPPTGHHLNPNRDLLDL